MSSVLSESTSAQRDVEHGRGTLAVGLDERPRLLLGDVLVRERARAHRLGDRGAEARRLDLRADLVERGFDAVEHARVGSVSSPGSGTAPKLRCALDERAVDEVAPVREQLVVVAAHELVPREVGVLRLRPAGGQVVAQRVRVVAAEEVARPRSRGRGSCETSSPPSSGTRSRRRSSAGAGRPCPRRARRPSP